MNTRSSNFALNDPRCMMYGFCVPLPAYSALISRVSVTLPDLHVSTCVPPDAGPAKPMICRQDGIASTLLCALVGLDTAGCDAQHAAFPDQVSHFLATSHMIFTSLNTSPVNSRDPDVVVGP